MESSLAEKNEFRIKTGVKIFPYMFDTHKEHLTRNTLK